MDSYIKNIKKIKIENSCSKSLINFLPLFLFTNLPILDAPCGRGRNSFLFLKEGFNVIGVDIDKDALEFIDISRHSFSKLSNSLNLVNLNLLSDLPFPHGYFGGIINVHFYNNKLLDAFDSLLVKGGLLYIETPGNHGNNYIDLPNKDEIWTKLDNHFEFIHYVEIPSKKQINKVSVKCLAQRH